MDEGEFSHSMKLMQVCGPKSIQQCLETSSLKPLIQKVQQNVALASLLHQILPTEIVPHCQVINLSQGTLTLQLDSPVWATRIHYLIPDLLGQLGKDFTIQKIRCQVNPSIIEL